MTKDDATATFLGFVLGVGVGAVSALLLAPKAGEELRDDIAGDQVQTILTEGETAYKKAKKAGA
jgi:gas vesicle protein